MSTTTVETRRIAYDDSIVRAFLRATMLWGLVGLALGVLVASQLSHHQANTSLPFLSFGRLRPLHTNGAIFAFVGNMMFAGIYYSLQRLLKARLFSDVLSRIHFWGWQLIIVAAALTLPFGLTQGKEYAELIWPIDVLVALIWVVFAVNFFGTIAKRNEKNLYVAIWFYIATVLTIPVLYIVNNLCIPTSWVHSYPVFGGVQDALVQWWYGHNAVAFFLTTPILGIMYYFLPKAVGRPVYSYRLSVVHFWSLVFLYIWAGPHHLLNSALPEWAQTLGMIFSLMLWAPSWGGMLNGLLTLRGAWDKLRTDPVIKFYIVGITFYGMSTFEGPLLSIKSVNGLAHYSDWIIAHVHGGTLGWNTGMAVGLLYWLIPKMWGTALWSVRLANFHFWTSTFGILLYVVAMWINGVNQGLFWRELNADGYLANPDFVEILASGQILYEMRLVGGAIFLAGYVLMLVNLIATMRAGQAVQSSVDVVVTTTSTSEPRRSLLFSTPVILALVATLVAIGFGTGNAVTTPLWLGVAGIVAIVWILVGRGGGAAMHGWHSILEGKSFLFSGLTLLAILVGGIVQIVPSVITRNDYPQFALDEEGQPTTDPNIYIQAVRTPLEQEGRDIYVSEGCYNCHSQMVRPFRFETLRFGPYSKLEEFIYDHPFQWGSKRTGPDLHRVGDRYQAPWHYTHFLNPRDLSPNSNMPAYAWLKDAQLDLDATGAKLGVLRTLGVPYTDADITGAKEAALSQGVKIAAELAVQGMELAPDSKLMALIAYMLYLESPQKREARLQAAQQVSSAGGR
jgi:cytochrome c oxidase cbb3-type subunit I/II